MKVKDILRKQNAYVRRYGGYQNIREADQTFNDMNRELIETMAAENGMAFVARFQFFGYRKLHVADGSEPVYIEYVGQEIQNFDTDFVVPTKDPELESMIRDFNKPGNPFDIKLLDKIIARIYAVGGYPTIWY